MNENTVVEDSRSVSKMAENKLTTLQRKAGEALPAARDYARSHPWMLAAAGLAALGGAIFMVGQSRRAPSRTEMIRAWLDDARAHLPRQKASLMDRMLGRKRSLFS